MFLGTLIFHFKKRRISIFAEQTYLKYCRRIITYKNHSKTKSFKSKFLSNNRIFCSLNFFSFQRNAFVSFVGGKNLVAAIVRANNSSFKCSGRPSSPSSSSSSAGWSLLPGSTSSGGANCGSRSWSSSSVWRLSHFIWSNWSVPWLHRLWFSWFLWWIFLLKCVLTTTKMYIHTHNHRNGLRNHFSR